MTKNFKIAEIDNNSMYKISTIDKWDSSKETKIMNGEDLKSFTNACNHLYYIHVTKCLSI